MSARSGAGLAAPADRPGDRQADRGLDPSRLTFPGGERFWDRAPAGGPADVPGWMVTAETRVRAGAQALDQEVTTVRRVRDTLRSLLMDAAAGLGWRGTGARSAEARAAALHGLLTAAADRLSDARDALSRLASELSGRRTAPGPAVEALAAADVRAAEALHVAAGELVRLRGVLATEGRLVGLSLDLEPVDAPARALADGIAGGVGEGIRRFWAGTLNTAASTANAAWNHPEALAEVVAGALLLDVGISGEILGLGLDVTGAGALAGVPVGAASAVPLAAGAGLLATGSATIMLNAAGPDRVTPMNMPARRTLPVDIERANFAQKTCSRRFSADGDLAGKTIDEVAAELRKGKRSPNSVPIDVVRREGQTLILNTRSSKALEEAGIPRRQWRVVDRTGQPGYERRLDAQLKRNHLDQGGVGSVEITD